MDYSDFEVGARWTTIGQANGGQAPTRGLSEHLLQPSSAFLPSCVHRRAGHDFYATRKKSALREIDNIAILRIHLILLIEERREFLLLFYRNVHDMVVPQGRRANTNYSYDLQFKQG